MSQVYQFMTTLFGISTTIRLTPFLEVWCLSACLGPYIQLRPPPPETTQTSRHYCSEGSQGVLNFFPILCREVTNKEKYSSLDDVVSLFCLVCTQKNSLWLIFKSTEISLYHITIFQLISNQTEFRLRNSKNITDHAG